MREYKFIAWDKALGKMSKPFTFGQILNFTDENGLGHMKSLDETHKIHQCLGLRDKNKNDIYSSYIIKYPDPSRVARFHRQMAISDEDKESCYTCGEVIVSDGSTWLRRNGSMVCIAWLMTPSGNPHQPTLTSLNLEIIGNIYQNPELLP